MKKLILVILLLGIITKPTVCFDQQELNEIAEYVDLELENWIEGDDEIYEFDDSREVGSLSDKIKAAKCLVTLGQEANALLDLYHDILHFRVIGGFKQILSLLKQLKPVYQNCGVFFCFGPSIKQCQQAEKTTCSKYRLRVYPDCQEGYTNKGCCKCWPSCPSGWKTLGRMCVKPKDYWRGTGYALWDKKSCEKHNPQGCEQDGLLIYPKCKEGYKPSMFSWCTPDCPSGYSNLGHTCLRPHKSYKRGQGYPMTIGEKCLTSSTTLPEDATCEQVVQEYIELQEQFDQIYEKFTDNNIDELERYLLIDTDFFNLLQELEVRYTFIHDNQCLPYDLIEMM